MSAEALRPHPLDRSSPLPLWAQLLADLRARIAAGEFDERFPTEQELTAAYGVSRQTVREAVRRLDEEGIVERERGRGTRVRTLEIGRGVGTLHGLFQMIEEQGVELLSEVRAREVRRDARAAGQLELPPSAALVYIERLRVADGTPIALDRVWLPDSVAHAVLEADLTHTGLYSELSRICGIDLVGGREQIRPLLPGPEERSALELDTDVAAFSIERLTWSSTGPVEWRESVVRGDRYTFVNELRPARAGTPERSWTEGRGTRR